MAPDKAWIWIGFNVLIVALLALDLGVFHRKARALSLKSALGWSAGWIALALLFNLAILFLWEGVYPGHEYRGGEAALLFLTGYLIELSLSVDNLFVMAVIFSSLSVPAAYQHRVLFWGILGALVMRGAMIAGGVALIREFHAVVYIFGAFLIFTAARMLFREEKERPPGDSRMVRLLRRLMPVTEGYEGQRFFVRREGALMATPLFLVLLLIESADLVFAVDSIPAILGITDDPFLVYASNVFAILGLRSLYFVLAGSMGVFHYLKPALSLILAFVGAKMLLADVYKIPPHVSLAVVGSILGIALALSLRTEWKRRREARIPAARPIR